MTTFRGLSAATPGAALQWREFEPPALRPHDVEIEVTHCGICHSDLHLIDDDWGISRFPLVPGHEVVGVVRDVGPAVDFLSVGQTVGVGWQSGACLHCDSCVSGHENHCARSEATCAGRPGGFADRLRTDGRFAFAIPDGADPASTAPLLCGGATVYSPLARFARAGAEVAVIGLGGLGHLAVRFAAAMGCRVTVLSSSSSKRADALDLGARDLASSTDAHELDAQRGRFDLIVSTVFSSLDWPRVVATLRPGGRLVLVGAPARPLAIPAAALLSDRWVGGSVIAGRSGIRDMLRFADAAGVGAVVESFAMDDANDALARLRAGDVRYRAVLRR